MSWQTTLAWRVFLSKQRVWSRGLFSAVPAASRAGPRCVCNVMFCVCIGNNTIACFSGANFFGRVKSFCMLFGKPTLGVNYFLSNMSNHITGDVTLAFADGAMPAFILCLSIVPCPLRFLALRHGRNISRNAFLNFWPPTKYTMNLKASLECRDSIPTQKAR